MAVLIVDHNPHMRDMLKSVLRRVDDTVYECRDAWEALDVYARLRPQWVVMDMGVNQTDGIAATRAIRVMDPTARVILLGEYDDRDFHGAAMDAGAHTYVLKDDLLSLPDVISAAPARTPDEVSR